MSNDFQQFDQPSPSQGGFSTGGCLMGCLAGLGVLVVLAICAGVGGYLFLTNQVEKYTAEAPVELPSVEYTAEEIKALETRLESFKKTVEAGDAPAEELVLTADDINALINKEKELRGRVFVKISEGQVAADVSFPADAIPGGKGRYFNGSVSLDVELKNGVLIVTLADAEVNGEQVPEQVLEKMSEENLAKDLYKDPKNAEVMSRVESIKIEDDKIILKMRAAEAKQSGETETDAAGG